MSQEVFSIGGAATAPPAVPKVMPAGLVDTGPSEFSGHTLDDAIKCPQLYAWKHVDGADPLGRRARVTTAPPLVKGTLGHQGLANYYARERAKQRGEDPNQFLAPLLAIETRAAHEGGVWPSFLSEVLPVVRWFLQRAVASPFPIEYVEDTLTLTLATGEVVTRSLDLGARLSSGRRFVDHKFVGRVDERTIGRYKIAGQMTDYWLIGQQMAKRDGIPFDGVWLNLVQWPWKDRKPTNTQVQLPRPSNGALRARIENIQRGRATIAHHAERGTPSDCYPRTQLEQVCNGPYSLCPAHELCLTR